MNALVFLPLLAAIVLCGVAAYLLSGLDDWYPAERRRDLDTIDRLPRARAAWRRLHEGER